MKASALKDRELVIQQKKIFLVTKEFAKNDLYTRKVQADYSTHAIPLLPVSKINVVLFWLSYKTNGKQLSTYYWVIVALGSIAKHLRS